MEITHLGRQLLWSTHSDEIGQPKRPQARQLYRHRDGPDKRRSLIDKAIGHPCIKAVIEPVKGKAFITGTRPRDRSLDRCRKFAISLLLKLDRGSLQVVVHKIDYRKQ